MVIGPGVKVESGAVIGDNVTIAAGVKVEQGAAIGANSQIGGPCDLVVSK